MQDWLGRVQHNLLKRLLWPARDRRDLGGAAPRGELRPRLVDEEGRPVSPQDLWQSLRADAPAQATTAALDAFGRALDEAVAAAERDDAAGVLRLEDAFAALRAGR
jgi:hypothetical protein